MKQLLLHAAAAAACLAKGKPLVGRTAACRRAMKAHLQLYPTCAACGGAKKVEAHHIIPVHVAPELSDDPDNLVSLCESKRYGVNCHLWWGHHGNYRTRYNPNVRLDALAARAAIKGAA